METRSLGADARVSVLGYGAWVTGADTASAAIDAERLERAISAALDAGITWLDTAELYGNGRSEELVGRAVRTIRDNVFLVTKVGPSGAGTGMRPDDIGRAIRASLRRLGTDRVDLFLLHWHDPSVPLEETWGAMTRLREEGLAVRVGVSNFDDELVGRCLSVGRVDAVENQLSLLHVDDVPLAARLSELGIAYLAYGTLAFGLLSGRVTPGSRLDPSDWRAGEFARYEANYYEELFAPGRIERSHAFARELARIAEDVGVPAPALALRWVLERPGVTAAIVGTTDPNHLRADCVAGAIRLDAAMAARIDGLVDRHRRAMVDAGEEAEWPRSSASTRD